MKQSTKVRKKVSGPVAQTKKKRKKPNQQRPNRVVTAKRPTSLSKKKKIKSSKLIHAKKKKRALKKRKQRHQFYKEIGVSFFLLMILLLTLQGVFFSVPKISGYGMTTTLDDGDRLFVSKRSTIKRFDLVYFRQPETKQIMVRRVVGLPEEEVGYENDQLLINKKPVVERYLENELKEAAMEKRLLTENFSLAKLTGSTFLPQNSYFVLGDNRHYASDSREFGWIEEKDILGVVKARILPFHHMTQF